MNDQTPDPMHRIADAVESIDARLASQQTQIGQTFARLADAVENLLHHLITSKADARQTLQMTMNGSHLGEDH